MTDYYGSYSRRHHSNFKWMAGLLTVIVGFIIIGGFIAWPIAWEHSTATYKNCRVIGKDRSTNNNGSSNVRIYTNNCGVFTIADDMFQHQWNSSDLYGKIQTGQSYTFNTVGWRNGFFSQFPNIVGVQ